MAAEPTPTGPAEATAQATLARRQRRATGCLVAAAGVFGLTLVLPPQLGVRWLQAGAEAAMVGGLADWFAVVALFRRPLGLPIPHTAIVPTHKDRIADALAGFVQDKFLHPEQVLELVRRGDPAGHLARWLATPGHAQALGRQALVLLRGWLHLVDDPHLRGLALQGLQRALAKVDLGHTLGATLDLLTHGQRHQQLLDAALRQALGLLQRPALRQAIAEKVVAWLRDEHTWAQKLLPTEWLGERAAQVTADIVERFLQEVADSPAHELRDAFDATVQQLVARLKHDPALAAQGQALVQQLLQHPALRDYVAQLWQALGAWLAGEAAQDDSALQARVARLGTWLGERLDQDPALRASVNGLAERIAQQLAPEVGVFAAAHIRKTMGRWDAQQLSRQVELHIGPDLQWIRISGTVVGGVIGLLLFAISHAGEVWRALGF